MDPLQPLAHPVLSPLLLCPSSKHCWSKGPSSPPSPNVSKHPLLTRRGLPGRVICSNTSTPNRRMKLTRFSLFMTLPEAHPDLWAPPGNLSRMRIRQPPLTNPNPAQGPHPPCCARLSPGITLFREGLASLHPLLASSLIHSVNIYWACLPGNLTQPHGLK